MEARKLIYAVYSKVYPACFLYTEEAPACTIQILKNKMCESVVGFSDFKLYNNNTSVYLCESKDCSDDCQKLVDDSGCIVAGNIQFPYSFSTDNNPSLFGKPCTERLSPFLIPAQSANNNFSLVTNGNFSNLTIAISASIVIVIFVFQFLKKII